MAPLKVEQYYIAMLFFLFFSFFNAYITYIS